LVKFSEGSITVSSGETSFSPEVLIADSTFFKLFDFNLLIGDNRSILSNPNTAIVTEDYAHKMFGDRNPIDQEIRVSTNDIKTFTIKGILKKLPSNSSITFDIMLPGNSGSYQRPGVDFVLANEKFNQKTIEKKIENLGNAYFNGSKLSVIPFSDIYF
jgi:putative ABC transport system permease protein